MFSNQRRRYEVIESDKGISEAPNVFICLRTAIPNIHTVPYIYYKLNRL